MKRIMVIFALFLGTFGVLVGQDDVSEEGLQLKPFDELVNPFQVEVVYGTEGAGFALTQNFWGSPIRPFFGIESVSGAQIGLKVGCHPLVITDWLDLTTALMWQYRLKIIATDNYPTPETFREKSRMVGTLRVGPTFKAGRFNLGIYYNVGQNWIPSNGGTSFQWEQGGALCAGIKL